MNYSIPIQIYDSYIFEPLKYYEIDLVKQWFSIVPGTHLNDTNEGKIIVINTGELNKHEGSDVKNAILSINGNIKIGKIEFHLKSSDWYKHGHHKNSDYNNVILHVVANHNINHQYPRIPTVVINLSRFDSGECNLTENNASYSIIENILHFSHQRWQSKLNNYDGLHNNPGSLKKKLIIDSFSILGEGGNKEQFIRLAKSIDFKHSLHIDVGKVEQYLIELSKTLNIQWKRKGIRPAQQPQNRITLAAELIKYLTFLRYDEFNKIENVKSNFLYHCPSAKGIGIQTELLGNVLIPYIASNALFTNNIIVYSEIFKIWSALRLPYSYNKYSKRFNGILSASELKSFVVLQGIIEIDRKWCKKQICNYCPLKKNHGSC